VIGWFKEYLEHERLSKQDIIQPIIALLLIVVVLLQQKGAGLGMTFGGSSNVYSTKRGFDKVLFNITIILSILFFGTALVSLIF
jgi:preprotein translocase subunit SecG